MIHAYAADYVDDAQRTLGTMLDFGVNECGYGAAEVMNLFIGSGVARQFAAGNPTYVVGMTGCELFRAVLQRAGLQNPAVDDAMYLDKSPEYWAGWALAYYQWYYDYTFSEILEAVPVDDVLRMYDTLHEADITKFVSVMDGRLAKVYKGTRFARMCESCGIAYAKLAEETGIPLEKIERWSSVRGSINAARAEDAVKVSKAIGCDVGRLLDRI